MCLETLGIYSDLCSAVASSNKFSCMLSGNTCPSVIYGITNDENTYCKIIFLQDFD